MNEYRGISIEQGEGFLDATTRLEQLLALIADADVKPEIGISLKIVDNLLGEMMDIDHNALITGSLELHDDMPKQGLTTNRHQGLGHGVGEGF